MEGLGPSGRVRQGFNNVLKLVERPRPPVQQNRGYGIFMSGPVMDKMKGYALNVDFVVLPPRE